MSAALMAQPGLHSMATAVSAKVKVKGKNRKRKKSTMAGGACATGGGISVIMKQVEGCRTTWNGGE